MTRRDVCGVCTPNHPFDTMVGDDDPSCCVCLVSMHTECKADSNIKYKYVKEWLIKHNMHDALEFDCFASYEPYEEIEELSDEELEDLVPDICPKCHVKVYQYFRNVLIHQYIQEHIQEFKNLSVEKVYIYNHIETPIGLFMVIENKGRDGGSGNDSGNCAWTKHYENFKKLQCEEPVVGPQDLFDIFGKYGWELLLTC